MNKKWAVLFLILLNHSVFGQNNYLSVGYRYNGLVFGNAEKTNGIRLNAYDRDTEKVNGINLSFLAGATKHRGVEVGILSTGGYSTNGVSIGGIFNYKEYVKGLMIGGYMTEANRIDGVAISMGVLADTLNGLLIGTNAVGARCLNGVGVGLMAEINKSNVKGVVFSLIMNNIDTLSGISVGLINESANLNGIQIGLWNTAKNKKRLKSLPFINFSFKRRNRGQKNT